jgi:cleavage and polyadenylation specificity factor subunit 1
LQDPLTQAGKKILRKGDFHLGTQVNAMLRMTKRTASSKPGAVAAPSKQQLCIVGNYDGSIGVVLPMDEKRYRRFLQLQGKMTFTLQHPCGLNPKAFR